MLARFVLARRQYIFSINNYNAGVSRSKQLEIVKLSGGAIDHQVLKTLAQFVIGIDAENLEELEEDIIWSTIQDLAKTSRFHCDFKGACDVLEFPGVGYKVNISIACLKFMNDVNRMVEKNQFESELQDSKQLKRMMKLVAGRLRPDALRDAMIEEVKYKLPDPLIWKDFFARLTYYAEMFHEANVLIERSTKKSDNEVRFSGKKRNSDEVKPKTSDQLKKKFKNNFGKGNYSEGSKKSYSKSSKTPSGIVCHHCGDKGHFKADCPLKSHQTVCYKCHKPGHFKKECTMKLVRIVGSSQERKNIPKIPYYANGIRVSILLDSGSEVNILPRNLWRSLFGNIPLKPTSLVLQVANAQTSNALGVMGLDLKIGTEFLSKEDFVVADWPGNELILGAKALEKLGINPVSNLLAKCASGGGGLDKVNVCSISYENNEVISETELCSRALKESVEKAVENGLSESKAEDLRKMLDSHREIFRFKEYSELPAKVPPAKLTLKADSTPFRCSARRYDSEKRLFIKETLDELVQKGALI